MTAGAWQALGGDTRGPVTALSQATPDAVFATTPVGVFRSRDAGLSWERAGSTNSVAFSETLATSASSVFVGASDGLHRSTDGGQTWQTVLADARVLCAALHPSAGLVVVGTENDGALRSDDDGRTWSGANAGLLDLTVLTLALSPDFETDGLGFAGTTSGLYRTRNAAQSWRAVDTGFDEPAIQSMIVAPTTDHERPVVVAGTEANGVLYSVDGGTRWQSTPQLDGMSVTAVACSPQGMLAAATEAGIAISKDGARSWTVCAPEMTSVLTLQFVVDDHGRDVLLAGSAQHGVWRSHDNGRTWTPANAGLHASLLSSLAISDATLVITGPNAGVRVSHDTGQTWREHTSGLGDATVLGISAGADGQVFAATSDGVFSCDARRDDSWRPRTSPPMGTRAVACGGDRVAVACEDGQVLVSEDAGTSWRALTTPFSSAGVLALAVNSETVFVATSSGGETVLWRSIDSGVSWQRWLVEPGHRAALSIAVSPNYRVDELVFVGLDSTVLRPSRGAEEVRNRERRPLWTRTTVARCSPRITSVAASADARSLFVATNVGVFTSRDHGQTFSAWNDGLDERPIVAIAQSQTLDVFALELGGQVWRRAVVQ